MFENKDTERRAVHKMPIGVLLTAPHGARTSAHACGLRYLICVMMRVYVIYTYMCIQVSSQDSGVAWYIYFESM